MTIKEIKEFFSNFNIRPKMIISDSTEVTAQDILEGKLFQKFIFNENISKIVSGFDIIDNEICYVYPLFKGIIIDTNDTFPPCGGKQELVVKAKYDVSYLSINNNTGILYSNEVCSVNAIIKLDNQLFTYNKPYIINNITNNSDKNIELNITATYYYKNVKYVDSKSVIQTINSNSSWIVEEEPTISIFIEFDKESVSNKGGIITAKVKRNFTRIYYMRNSCGEVVGGKSEPGLVEDITNKCLITSSNRKQFIVSKNIITVLKQDIGAPERECTITARFLDKTANAILKQEKGEEINYRNILSFVDGSLINFIDLETSIPTEKEIKIISKKHEYVDGEYDKVILNKKLKVESDSKWLGGNICFKQENVCINVITTETNTDKENDREGILTISCIDNPETQIKLVVSQQALSVIKEEYYCDFDEDGEYTSEEFKSKQFSFIPYKILVYEDGSKQVTEIEKYLVYRTSFYSSNDSLLSLNRIVNDNNKYILLFNDYSSNSIKDIQFSGKLIFYGPNGKRAFESETANVIIKGTQIIDYNYELCFDEHNKFKEVIWDETVEGKYIKINSLKHKLINGEYAGDEPQPFKIGIFDDNGNEYYDDSFSIKIINNSLFVFPVKTDKNYEKLYTITQKETGDKIHINFKYKNNNKPIKVNLKVIVYCDNIDYDIWTGENGYLKIDNDKTIKLNPCWLSPNMADKIDVSYNGEIELEEGLHKFETFNILKLNSNKTHQECNIYKEIFIDENNKYIVLKIKIN